MKEDLMEKLLFPTETDKELLKRLNEESLEKLLDLIFKQL